ncbi:hypothetical protein H8N03_21000 [Ramlibacter sp. USB13]|uniref:Uncharacterized protein n=1 Tax=Ramlibacter cellulosilyticus TaxID=2764187 RepID=A0A923SD11_9BURK|nr:hypothetical protein [Ramlibacter cellulosilyticus]MBC5785439.1 hypothetical protein [Ramlibacter cellulosilyticus]
MRSIRHTACLALALVAAAASAQVRPDLPPQHRSSGTVATTSGYDASVQALMAAADALRESIQAMAQQPAGPRRDQAIRNANRALLQTQVAMADAYDATAFPPSTRTMGAGAAVTVAPARCLRLPAMWACR